MYESFDIVIIVLGILMLCFSVWYGFWYKTYQKNRDDYYENLLNQLKAERQESQQALDDLHGKCQSTYKGSKGSCSNIM